MSKTPIMLSALVCPGFGQFMQRRKVAGAIYLMLILASCVSLLAFFLNIVIVFSRFGLAPETLENARLNLIGFAVSSAIFIIIYISSLIDTISAEKTQNPPPVPPSRTLFQRFKK